MTVCNMSIEAGARAGMIAPDETTFAYLKGRPHAPKGADWDAAVEYWRTLRTDDDAVFDTEVVIDAADADAVRHLGHQPRPGRCRSAASVPDPAGFADPTERAAAERALEYMGLTAGTPLRDVAVDTVFVGSCTNGRIEDLRAAADVLRGRQVADGVRMLVVPGSMRVKAQAEAEGLDEVFKEAGAEWREAGCSMCLGMNPDTARARRAQRLDLQPQLRGPAGQGRPHPPGLAAGRRRHRRHRPAGRARRPRDDWSPTSHGSLHHPHRPGRAAAPQQRRHRPDHPRRLAQAGQPDRLRGRPVRRLARGPGLRPQRPARTRAPRSWSPAPTSAPAPRASTPSGPCSTTASAPSSRPASATSSAATPPRSACCRSCCPSRRRRAPCRTRSRRTRPREITVDLEARQVRCGGERAPPSRSTTTPAGG